MRSPGRRALAGAAACAALLLAACGGNPHGDPIPQSLELARSTEEEKQSQIRRLRELHRDAPGLLPQRTAFRREVHQHAALHPEHPLVELGVLRVAEEVEPAALRLELHGAADPATLSGMGLTLLPLLWAVRLALRPKAA